MSNLAAFRTGWVTLSQDFREKGSSLGNIFGFYKTRHILLSDSANFTVLRAIVLTQYRRVTNGQTDGIAVASTALAIQRAVKWQNLGFSAARGRQNKPIETKFDT